MILNACVEQKQMVDENICKHCGNNACRHAGEPTTRERLAKNEKELIALCVGKGDGCAALANYV